MSGDTGGTQDTSPALVAVLMEIERHVADAGWDQPTRLFALVRTADLLRAQPDLVQRLGAGVRQRPDDALTAVEQEEFTPTDDLVADLAAVQWPSTVWGCAVAVERNFLPPDAEADLPDDPAELAAAVERHPRHQEIRVVVGVDRSGEHHGIGRLRSDPEHLLGSASLVPGLNTVLAHTLV